MVNRPKAKGTAGETKVVRYLQAHGIEAQRRALAGSGDTGDVEYFFWDFGIRKKQIFEIKSGKQTANYSRGTKEEWLRQTREEAGNAGLDAHLVINIHNRSIENAEVWSPDGKQFWYLDDFVKEIGGTFEEH